MNIDAVLNANFIADFGCILDEVQNTYQVPIVVSNFSLMQEYPRNKNKGSFVVCTLMWYVLCFITPKIHDWNALSSIHNETHGPKTICSHERSKFTQENNLNIFDYDDPRHKDTCGNIQLYYNMMN